MGALLLSIAYRKLTLPKLQDALVKTLEITALIMVLVAASNFFGAVFARLGTPTLLTEFLLGLEMNKYLILAMIMVMIFFARMAIGMGANCDDYSADYITFS
jgi:TRAP-type C4-dicarboxylate transport system permease large subunit